MISRKRTKYASMIFIVVVCMLSGCVDKSSEAHFDDVHVVYEVRDIHIGYEGGYSIIMVEYYDDDIIRTIDNQMGVHYRVNRIDVKRSTDETATLSLYAVNRHHTKNRLSWSNREFYPRSKYVLCIPDYMNLEGLKTYTYHTDYEDDESFID